ncbi:MAG: class I SAM-dependent methyltransferase [Parcubacteria group bacterium]|jgi:ubiquinone/menaquinone biosynthesis C-methylase UbiE
MNKNNSRFSGALAGKNLASIRFSAPHQDKFQKMIGKKLKDGFKKFCGPRISVIEIGTGAGLTSVEILKADKRIILESIDNEPKMIRVAEKNLNSFIASGRLELILEDALKYLRRIPGGSVDSLASAMTLHNFKRVYRENILREIFRVLQPQGIFINADKYVPDDEEEYGKEYAWQLRQFNKAPNEKIRTAWIEHYKTDNKPEIIMRAEESIAVMLKIGFKNIKINSRCRLEALLTAKKQ